MREPKSEILVVVWDLVSAPLLFTLVWATSTPALIWPYRVTSAIAATGRVAKDRAIRDFFIAVFLFYR